MGTIVTRRRKDGAKSFLAQIVIKKDGKIVVRENKTFERKSAAMAWIETREEALEVPGALDTYDSNADKDKPTLEDAIDRYIRESNKEIGRTKTQVLNAIKEFDIAGQNCESITSDDIVAFARQKLKTGVQPQTVGNYMSHLGAIFAIARPAWKYPLDPRAMEDAFVVTQRLGITSKSKERDRRPTLEELDLLMQHFIDRSNRRPSSIPMHIIIAFAIFSTRRQEEIIRILRKDLDKKGGRILIRDMKHPGQKSGNDIWCDLDPNALAIIQAMPRLADQIFPYTTDAIGAAFTRACQFLGIEDLRFHDLRHEGVSRLFEMGNNIPHVSAHSGHRSWKSLQRYTHLRHVGDKYEDWKWMPVVIKSAKHLKLIKNGSFPRRRRSERSVEAQARLGEHLDAAS